MKRYISLFFIVIICFLLQTAVFQNFKLANVVPNFMLVVTASSGFMYGRKFGMYSGILCGVLMDFMYGDIIGVNILIYVLVGYINGKANKLYFKDDLSIPVFSLAISDMIYNILYYAISFLLRGRLNILSYLRNLILPEIIYTVVVGLVIYKFMHYIENKMYPPVEVPLTDNGADKY